MRMKTILAPPGQGELTSSTTLASLGRTADTLRLREEGQQGIPVTSACTDPHPSHLEGTSPHLHPEYNKLVLWF